MRCSTSKTELEELYVDEKLSTRAIGARLGWSETTIAKWLRAFGIPLRSRGPGLIQIPRDELEELYVLQGLSLNDIGKLYNCTAPTVRRNLSRCEIECRPRRVAHPKNDFDGTLADKAYLIGLRLGDLHVFKPSDTSGIIVVRCHSTLSEQHQLFRGLFERYGHVWQGNADGRNASNAYAYLNLSFNFLLPKEDRVESWIQEDSQSSAAFVAGYVDAEGSFGIYEERARFKLDSQDRNILMWIHHWLESKEIVCPPLRRIARAGDLSNNLGNRLHRDVWRITVNRVESLFRLIRLIQPILKHAKRRKNMLEALENVSRRCEIG